MRIRTASAVGLGTIALAGALYGLDRVTAPIRTRKIQERALVRQAVTKDQAIEAMRLFAQRGGSRGDRQRFAEFAQTAGEACPKEELLTLAATSRHPEVMAWLLGLGALPGGGSHPAAPLLASAGAGDVRGVRMLLQAGAAPDPAPSNEDGRLHPTPLVAAICSGSLDCVDALLAAGADPHRPVSISTFTVMGIQNPAVVRTKPFEGRRIQRMSALELARLARNPTMALIVERKRAPQESAGRLAFERS